MGINCRAAMLEMGISAEGMAKILGIDRALVVRMCVGGEDLPLRLERKIAPILDMRHTAKTQRPIMEIVREMLWEVYRCGPLPYREINRRFGLMPQHLYNVQQFEGWVAVHWEDRRNGFYGAHPVIYLRAAGYIELGVVMPVEAPQPPAGSRPMVSDQLNETRRTLLESIEMQLRFHREMIDNLETMRLLLVTGYYEPEQVVDLYDRLTENEVKPLKITSEDKDEE